MVTLISEYNLSDRITKHFGCCLNLYLVLFTETDVNTRCKQGQINSILAKSSEVQIKGAKNDIEKNINA